MSENIEKDDPTARRILAAALRSFGHQGFKGTTMRSVAQAAGVSRPTVYARYANKEVLFAAVVKMVNRDAVAAASEALKADGELSAVLEAVLVAYFGSHHRQTYSMPHIGAVLEIYEAQAREVIAQGHLILRQRLGAFLQHRIDAGEIHPELVGAGLDGVLDVLMMAPTGLKRPDGDSVAYELRLKVLARMVAASLQGDAQN